MRTIAALVAWLTLSLTASAQQRMLDRSAPVNWSNPLNRGLVSWWIALPDQQRGAFWRDIARKNDGLLTNMDPPTDWNGPHGRIGGFGSLDFDSVDDFVTCGDRDDFTFSNGLTIVAWEFRMTLGSNGPLVQKYDVASNLEFNWGFLDNQCYFWAYDQSAGAFIGRRTGTFADDIKVWSHWAVTYDGGTSSSGIRIYRDGVRVDTTDFNSGAFVAIENLSSPLKIGGTNGGFGGPLTSFTDDVRVFNMGKSETEVQRLYLDSRTGYRLTLNWLDGFYRAPDAPPANDGAGFLPLLSSVEPRRAPSGRYGVWSFAD